MAKRNARASAAQSTQQQQTQQVSVPPSAPRDLNWYIAQYAGLVCVIIGPAILIYGYDKGWMNNTLLCWVCLGFCLLGLFFHEHRPFNVSML